MAGAKSIKPIFYGQVFDGFIVEGVVHSCRLYGNGVSNGRVHDGATHRHDVSVLRALGVKLIGPRCDRSFAMRAHGVNWAWVRHGSNSSLKFLSVEISSIHTPFVPALQQKMLPRNISG